MADYEELEAVLMGLYMVGMIKEQHVPYEAESPEEAKYLAQLDNPDWTVVGANDA